VKRLFLLRHAKSSWADHRLGDAERPLAPRGERDAPRVGGRLHAHGCAPDCILSSTARRAEETARRVADPLGYARAAICREAALYLASPEDIVAIVAAQRAAIATLLLVGHNPGLTELAGALAPKLALANLPTAGVVGFEIEADDWSEWAAAPRRLVYFDFPKNPDAPQT
jgi:phosphohistidine phosphatase